MKNTAACVLACPAQQEKTYIQIRGFPASQQRTGAQVNLTFLPESNTTAKGGLTCTPADNTRWGDHPPTLPAQKQPLTPTDSRVRISPELTGRVSQGFYHDPSKISFAVIDMLIVKILWALPANAEATVGMQILILQVLWVGGGV